MLDANDPGTFKALATLCDVAKDAKKPLVYWIGAGASAWCGYELWTPLADQFHSEFNKHEPSYDAAKAHSLIETKNLSAFFQLCKESSSTSYFRLMEKSFLPRAPTPVYLRFLQAIRMKAPIRILTTNIDELLEKNFPSAATISYSDIERVPIALGAGQAFICKLHGSISSLESIIFTQSDYEQLLSNRSYIAALERTISSSTVVFVGYSLQDEYLLSLLARNNVLARLLGDGPHFAVLPTASASLPESVKVIRYCPVPHKDHRGAIQVVEELGSCFSTSEKGINVKAYVPLATTRSAHFLCDVIPPGTWNTSHTVGFGNESGSTGQFITGTGFTDMELPVKVSTAMHDVMMGLLCFDEIVSPLTGIGRLHSTVGSPIFWRLIQEGILKVVDWEEQEVVTFSSEKEIAAGDVGVIKVLDKSGSPLTFSDRLKSEVAAAPGKEDEANALFSMLERVTVKICDEEDTRVPNLIRGLLLRPSVRKILGMSDGTPINSIPRWQVFPVLRLARVVRVGETCRMLGIRSAKLSFGTAKLAGPAFSISNGTEWTDDVASYIMAGKFNANLGAIVQANPAIFDAVINFRNSAEGEALRKEITVRLAASDGAEVNLAVNSALEASIPLNFLQQTRDKYIEFLVPTNKIESPPPALWADSRFSDDNAVKLWRLRSKQIFEDWCEKTHAKLYEPCPCGSGERLKFCCHEALNRV